MTKELTVAACQFLLTPVGRGGPKMLRKRYQKTHGGATGGKSPEYISWLGMKTRCNNPGATHYSQYGGRGIKVCARWNGSFAAFLADVGPRPGPGYTLGRKDGNKDYEPGNVRWETPKQQGNNTSRNAYVTYNGETRTLKEWAEMLGLNYYTLHMRVRRKGQSFPDAVQVMKQRGPGRGRRNDGSY